MHAVATAEAVGSHLADPVALALEQERVTGKRALPWYQATTQLDRARAAHVAAVIEGRRPAGQADPVLRDFATAAALDPDMFRAFLEMTFLLALPQEIFSRPGFAERARDIAGDRSPAPPPGPTRPDLLAMLP